MEKYGRENSSMVQQGIRTSPRPLCKPSEENNPDAKFGGQVQQGGITQNPAMLVLKLNILLASSLSFYTLLGEAGVGILQPACLLSSLIGSTHRGDWGEGARSWKRREKLSPGLLPVYLYWLPVPVSTHRAPCSLRRGRSLPEALDSGVLVFSATTEPASARDLLLLRFRGTGPAGTFLRAQRPREPAEEHPCPPHLRNLRSSPHTPSPSA